LAGFEVDVCEGQDTAWVLGIVGFEAWVGIADNGV